MDAKELLSASGEKVVGVRLGDSLREAVHILAFHNVGALVVLDAGGKLAGIISERDIMQGVDEFGPQLMDMPVDDLLTERVITCGPREGVRDIMGMMDANGIRHVPVVDGQNLLGVISIRGVLGAWMAAPEDAARPLGDPVPA